MRIRTIKPEFWSSEDMAVLPFVHRLVFVGLWSMADDEGRLSADPRLIRSQLFPLDDHIGEDSVRYHGGLTEDSVSIHDILTDLSRGGQITLYRGPGKRIYCQVDNFARHQKINRPTPSKIPAPTTANTILTEDSVSPHGVVTEDSPPEQGTGNREQGTGNREQGPPSLRSGVRGDTTSTPPSDLATASGRDVVADAPAKQQTKLGARLPDQWQPARTSPNLNVEQPHSPDWLDDQLNRFRDYWHAQPGAKGRKTDWDATWRNWIRNATDHTTSRRQQETDAQYQRAKHRAATGTNPLIDIINGAA
ncbi:hypothetical protein [Acidipropionibacterium timonense]|uniref:hypothetical protein n=1 Tax=Acidipropionibacterium timonense TaxID=2161818 RepID=UPI00102F6306|nr:hypothetical protein [Acidipropionibacterium timonense]